MSSHRAGAAACVHEQDEVTLLVCCCLFESRDILFRFACIFMLLACCLRADPAERLSEDMKEQRGSKEIYFASVCLLYERAEDPAMLLCV